MVTDASSLHLMQGRARFKDVTVGRLKRATRRGLSDRVLKPLHPSIAEHLMRQIMHYDKEFRREVATSAVGSSAKHWRFGSNGARGPMRPHPHAGQAGGRFGVQWRLLKYRLRVSADSFGNRLAKLDCSCQLRDLPKGLLGPLLARDAGVVARLLGKGCVM